MQLFVKTLENETITLEVNPSDTVEDLKAKLSDKGAFSSGLHRLIFAGQLLKGKKLLMSNVFKKISLVFY